MDSFHAAAAYLSGHYGEARSLLDGLGDKVNLAAFQGYGGRLEVAKEDLKTHPNGQVSSESTAEPREVQLIYSVTVFSPREKELIYDEDGSTAAFNGTVREVSGDHKVVYRFVIPEDVPAADCTLWVGNQFAISVAADAGGKPGEFHEELNAITMLGRKVYDQENKYWYTVNLTPYLKNNPSRTVYLAVTDAEPRDGWGALISRLDVAVLDEAERARVRPNTGQSGQMGERGSEPLPRQLRR